MCIADVEIFVSLFINLLRKLVCINFIFFFTLLHNITYIQALPSSFSTKSSY